MEGFNDLLLKLRDVHEREVEGWQVKVQELSNKKGCDTKRMEELFTRNQQMKEQQRLLTENIKTLENRLRAGLCDRCSVTQEVANRRQQEYEASQIQSLQHISRMVGEMNHMKKENKRLRDEIGNLRAALEGHSDHSSNSSNITEVKPNSSPDLSASSGPVALITVATSTANYQPSDGNVGVKTETDQRTEEAEHRQLTGMNRGSFESYKPLSLSTLASPSWRTEHGVPRAGERRAQSIEGLDQRSSIPPSIPLQNSSSITGEEVNATRHVLHTPVPCRPHPIKSSSVTLPWPLSESSDWVSVAAAGTSQGMHPTSKPNLPRFPNLIPTSLHASPRRQVFGSPWPKHSTSQALLKEPTLVFRLRSLSEHVDNQIKPQEKKETQLTKAERVSAEGLREMYEGPLDLSERGKYKSSQTAKDNSTLVIQGGERVHKSPDKDVTGNTSTCIPVSSPSPVIPLSSSSSPPVKQQEEEPISDHNQKQAIKDQEQKDEVNGKTEQNNEKKVPVLTISLRPVVVLETLNSALQKQDALSSNGKSLPTIEPGSSSEEQVEEESVSSQESSQGCKRKRTSAEREADRDSDTDNIQHERNIKITVGTEEEEP